MSDTNHERYINTMSALFAALMKRERDRTFGRLKPEKLDAMEEDFHDAVRGAVVAESQLWLRLTTAEAELDREKTPKTSLPFEESYPEGITPYPHGYKTESYQHAFAGSFKSFIDQANISEALAFDMSGDELSKTAAALDKPVNVQFVQRHIATLSNLMLPTLAGKKLAALWRKRERQANEGTPFDRERLQDVVREAETRGATTVEEASKTEAREAYGARMPRRRSDSDNEPTRAEVDAFDAYAAVVEHSHLSELDLFELSAKDITRIAREANVDPSRVLRHVQKLERMALATMPQAQFSDLWQRRMEDIAEQGFHPADAARLGAIEQEALRRDIDAPTQADDERFADTDGVPMVFDEEEDTAPEMDGKTCAPCAAAAAAAAAQEAR